jgi:lipoprotein-releasing system permease protein
MKFELLVAIRYLKAKRKQAVISLITLISIVGVAAGVAALIIALAITAGFREDLEKKLLGAQAHIDSSEGSQQRHRRLPEVTKQVEQVPGVSCGAGDLSEGVAFQRCSVERRFHQRHHP